MQPQLMTGRIDQAACNIGTMVGNPFDITDNFQNMTAGMFVSIAAWTSFQRNENETPWWGTLKASGELNPKYPGGMVSGLSANNFQQRR